MKKQIPPFLAGVLTALLVLSLGASALAASGRLTLEVDPVRIQVDGSQRGQELCRLALAGADAAGQADDVGSICTHANSSPRICLS